MTIDEVLTELTMSYSHKMHLILEGDGDGKFLLSVIADDSAINAICVYGADRVIETVARYEGDPALVSRLKILGVIDRDYREPLRKLPNSRNVLVTDHRDLECMMIDSPVFTRVLRELGSKEKIRTIGGVSAVKQKIVNCGRLLGELRFYSQLSESHWTFQKLELTKFMDKKTIDIDTKKLIAHLNAHQNVSKAKLSLKTIQAAHQSCNDAKCLKQMQYFAHDLLICRGHDLMGILSFSLRTFCGSLNATECTVERLEAIFRVGYAPYFSRSKLFKGIVNWLSSNGLAQNIALQ